MWHGKIAHLFTILSTVDNESKSRIRAVVGLRMVDVLQTLGCDVISHAGLGRAVVDVACDATIIDWQQKWRNENEKEWMCERK